MTDAKTLWLSRLAVVLRVFLGLTFVYAAVLKAMDPAALADEIANYRMLPAGLVPLAAATLPGIELASGLFLVLGIWTRASAAIIGGMLVVFIIALSAAMARGLDIQCGCFGDAAPVDIWLIWRDVAYLAVAVGIILWDKSLLSLGPPIASKLLRQSS